jgi:hypothetical protein
MIDVSHVLGGRQVPKKVQREPEETKASQSKTTETRDHEGLPWPIAPEPVPEDVVEKAKAVFARRSADAVRDDSASSSAGKPSRRRPSPPTDGLAS